MFKNTRRKVGLVIIISLIFLSVATKYANAITTEEINNFRINVYSNNSSVTVRVGNEYNLFIDEQKVDFNIANGSVFVVNKDADKVSIVDANKKVVGSGNTIKFKKKDNNVRYLEINTGSYSKYPDNLTLRLDSAKSKVLAINETPIETYLKGVVPHEIGASAPLEALKAQAITARTFAVNRVNNHNKDGYDVVNTTTDQVYKGYNETYFNPSHNVYKAIEGTKGEVLTYNGTLIEGLYYSNNGGYTAANEFVWGYSRVIPYYVSRRDAFDLTPHKSTAGWAKINYELEYTGEELRNVIIQSSKNNSGYFKPPYTTPAFTELSKNFTIEILDTENGYVKEIKLSDDEGHSYIVKNSANRWLFNLRSQKYTMEKAGGSLFVKSDGKNVSQGTTFIKGADGTKEVMASDVYIKNSNRAVSSVSPSKYYFKGSGYGHGVGMSQNGAMNRAESGQNYKEILEFYYKGTVISTNYDR